MRKLRSKKGFTLTETLLCVALLAIMSAAGAVASGVVISVRNGMIETADAEILGSTALETLADEVRYGQNIAMEQESATETTQVLKMDSLTYGTRTYFKVKDGYLWVDSASLAGKDAEYHMVVSESAYTHLKVGEFKMEQDSSSGTIEISVAVENSGGKELWSGSVTVKPLNGI